MYTPKRANQWTSKVSGYHSLTGRTASSFASGAVSSPLPTAVASPLLSRHLTGTPEARRSFGASTTKVIERAETHELVTYGTDIPVEVASLLASHSQTWPVLIESTGWAAVIHDNKLLAWRYSISLSKKLISCISLPLAPSQLRHSRRLTCIGTNNTSKTTVVNVSPEGVVRYWSNVTRPSAYVELSLALDGKVCQEIIPLAPYGFLLVTTTGEMFNITTNNLSLQSQQVTIPSSMLTGWSLTSFWGQNSTQNENDILPVICCGTVDYSQEERYFYVVAKGKLQKWQVTGELKHEFKMVLESNLLSSLKSFTDSSLQALGNADDIEVIDMQNTGYGMVILFKAVINNESVLPLLGLFKSAESRFETVIQLDNLVEESQLTVLSADYLAFVSSPDQIVSHSISKNTTYQVKIELTNDALLSAGINGKDALFFSRQHGILNLKITTFTMLLQHTQMVSEVAMEGKEETIEIVANNDTRSVLRNAYIAYTNRHPNTKEVISGMEVSGSEFHDAIIDISRELVDSPPPSDPRWAGHANSGFGTSSVLIQNQLQDKEKIHSSFFDFLLQTNCFDKLSPVEAENIKNVLVENQEKLQCCTALLDLYSQYTDAVSSAINLCIKEQKEKKYNDTEGFFSCVSGVDRFFSCLMKLEAELLLTLKTVKEQVDLIQTVSSIFANCYTCAWKVRQVSQSQLNITQPNVPWTGSSRGINNRSLLKHQIAVSLEQGLPKVGNTKTGSELTQSVVLLADLLLDAYDKQIDSISGDAKAELSEEYRQQKQQICHSLISHGYYEQAATIGEKYEDYLMLILLCEKTNDSQRLNRYKSLFLNQGFENELYRYYMENGCWEKLISNDGQSNELDSFLASHDHLSWLHNIGSKNYNEASLVLDKLAGGESEFAARKKMLYALSNLATMASEDLTDIERENKIRDTDKAIELLEYQEETKKIMQDDVNSLYPPCNAQQLIEELLSDRCLTEAHFTMSIDLLQHLEEKEECLLDIWSKCIYNDRWEATSQIDRAALSSQKMFYKCLKYCRDNEFRHPYIPPLDALVARLETDLLDDTHYRYQLQACYELLELNVA